MIRLTPFIILIWCSAAFSAQIKPEQIEFFEKKIRPVLMGSCFKCHGGEKTNNGLRLDHLSHMTKGGNTGPAIIPGHPEKSLLIQAIRRTHKDLKMPPKKPLDDRVIADLVQWIKIGAPWPESPNTNIDKQKNLPAIDHWSFKPLTHPAPPQTKNDSWSITPIDRFILASLKTNNLKPNAPADKRTLIRRATFDLIGLPPTPKEIDDFLNDDLPGAFRVVVERLLASKHYGERWGRHWLDVVRYADTAGDNSDYPVPQLYRYRNYVIDSFNQDKPYNLFVQEQIAGDLMDSRDEDEKNQRLIATGYIAISRRFGSQINGYPQHLTIEDTIDNLGKTFLGLTISCARCHDHKFDPVSMQDYYGLYGFFSSTRYPFPGIELEKAPRDLIPLIPQDQYKAIMKPYLEKLIARDKEIVSFEKEKKEAEKKFQKINNDIRKQQANKTDNAKELQEQKDTAQALVDKLRRKIKSAKGERDKIAKDAPHVELAYAVAEAKPANARIHLRGEPKDLGKEVPRRFLDQLGGQTLPDEVDGSGRLHLARWMTDPENPLTARVMVNRIWQYHFGKAIVQTSNNFGKQGKKPTHPHLLDFLATRFIERGWSIKDLHRLIMSSQTYQLAAGDNPNNNNLDPENQYYWKFDRRRLDAEAIRDAMLLVSG
ncbi:MAG: PSD1 domain-containing protein, partial [Planctomycetes bacterium]|nr:PSD1 domain-containing protein [Planctomycetota bacterium]